MLDSAATNYVSRPMLLNILKSLLVKLQNRKDVEMKICCDCLNWLTKRCINVTRVKFQMKSMTLHSFAELAQPVLKVVDFSDCKYVTDAMVFYTALRCPQLSEINLTNCQQVTDASLVHLRISCPHLTVLRLRKCNISNDGLEQLHFMRSLKTLDLSHCYAISDDGIRKMFTYCRGLREIYLDGLEDMGILHTLAVHSPGLEVLSVEECDFSSETSALDMRDFHSIRVINLSSLLLAEGLTLRLRGPAKPRPSLKVLNVAEVQISDECIIDLTQRYPCVETIKLAGCDVSDAAVYKMAATWQDSLQHIDLSQSLISDIAIMSLSHLCPLLECVSLRKCHKITDAALIGLSNCHRLTKLDLAECGGLTDVSLMGIAQGYADVGSFPSCIALLYGNVR